MTRSSRNYLGRIVRGTIEETLKPMLDAKGCVLVGASRAVKADALRARQAIAASGEVTLKVPELRAQASWPLSGTVTARTA